MNILFVGNHPTQKIIESSKGRIDSLYRSNEAIINGLRQHPEINLSVITSPDIASYPHQNLYFSEDYSEPDDCTMVSMLNLPIIKHFWTAFSLFKKVYVLTKNNEGPTFVIIPYMVFRHVLALRLISKFCRNTKVGLVVPDIFFHKSIINKALNNWTEVHARKSDFFILYTEAMADYLGINSKPHITIEGFKQIKPFIVEKSEKFIVLYSGTLNIEYGINRLLDAISLIDLNIELHIYGSGNGEKLVKEAVINDSRIHFFGKVSKTEADKALITASVVINPRNENDGEYVKYSFPSKDIDYLASGHPSILCKLPGMPIDYYPYFVDGKSGSSLDIAMAIEQVYNMNFKERDSIAQNAYRFIEDRMNPYNQASKIIELLSTLKK